MRKNLGEEGWLQEIAGCFLPTEQDNLRQNLQKIVNDSDLSKTDIVKKLLKIISSNI